MSGCPKSIEQMCRWMILPSLQPQQKQVRIHSSKKSLDDLSFTSDFCRFLGKIPSWWPLLAVYFAYFSLSLLTLSVFYLGLFEVSYLFFCQQISIWVWSFEVVKKLLSFSDWQNTELVSFCETFHIFTDVTGIQLRRFPLHNNHYSGGLVYVGHFFKTCVSCARTDLLTQSVVAEHPSSSYELSDIICHSKTFVICR